MLSISVLLLIAHFPILSRAHAETAEPQTIRQAYPPPSGAARVAADAFGDWLGQRTLEEPSVPVRTFDGRIVPQDARVITLPLVPGDLQQCADTALRLRAEWLRETGQPISFHATSGDPVSWARWQGGERPKASGNSLVWRSGGAVGDSEASWNRYLSALFTWAGTASLQAHDTVAVVDPLPGDVVVQGGFPGHAVLLVDVAVGAHDETYVLVAEGFMPAQSAHIQHGPIDGWWSWDPEAGLALPYWPLSADKLRRWR